MALEQELEPSQEEMCQMALEQEAEFQTNGWKPCGDDEVEKVINLNDGGGLKHRRVRIPKYRSVRDVDTGGNFSSLRQNESFDF